MHAFPLSAATDHSGDIQDKTLLARWQWHKLQWIDTVGIHSAFALRSREAEQHAQDQEIHYR